MTDVNYYPGSAFIPGGSVRTNVERWEVRGRRVVVQHTDGTRWHSERTPGDLAADTSLIRCPCPDSPSRDCRIHGDGN